MQYMAEKLMNAAQRLYIVYHDKQLRHAPQPFKPGKYIYTDRVPMKTSVAEKIATKL